MSHPNSLIRFATLLLSTVVGIHTAPVQTHSKPQIYLSQFGYLSENSGVLDMIPQNTLVQAIHDFQEFAGLNVTGQLDSKTLELMSMPRCGVKDKNPKGRSKRASYGSIWSKKDLTYRISEYTKRMDRDDVDAEIARAFNLWSEQTDLSFTAKSNGPVDIDIKFVRGEHGCKNTFDGRGGTLAHAYYPDHGGVHFDDAEHWSSYSSHGTNLFQIAAHEFGHAIGLDHSSVRRSVMYPTGGDKYESNFRLHGDDIWRIQQLYGSKTNRDRHNRHHHSHRHHHRHHHHYYYYDDDDDDDDDDEFVFFGCG